MSDYIEVMAIVEGQTEELFIKKILREHLAAENIYISATQVTKPGQKGGDVRFNRVRNDLEQHLKQRSDTYVTTMVDYYGVKEWPGLNKVPPQASPREIARIVNDATKDEVIKLFADQQAARRFIPYMAIHEFEALLFSRSSVIAEKLKVTKNAVNAVLDECGEPEAINNNRNTAPSKRLDRLSPNKKFAKTTVGIDIAEAIGIATMRKQCPLFNQWLKTMENIQGKNSVQKRNLSDNHLT